MERPLDTIRSFEAAVEDTYARRPGVFDVAGQGKPNGASKRNSYAGGMLF